LDYLRQVDPLPRNVRRFQKQRDAILAELEGSGSDLPYEWVAQRLGVSVVRYVALCRIVAAVEPISIQESPKALRLAG
jgi:hypothetical protein